MHIRMQRTDSKIQSASISANANANANANPILAIDSSSGPLSCPVLDMGYWYYV